MPQQALSKLIERRHLTREEANALLDKLMDGRATPAQIGALLVALRMKGETVEEVTGFALGMRSRVVPVRPQRTPLLDTCGTGGSRFRVFNVSTCAAFVAAAAGIPIAKHGNRAMSGICGSADVLEALGVRINLSPEQCAACIDTVGIGFLFAQQHHPAMKQVSGPRRDIGVRSIFNLLGPLTNPAGATRQVMGVYASELCPLAAGALRELGSERALVVHGEIGLDEISTIGPTRICELRDGDIRDYRLTPEEMGLQGPPPSPEALLPLETPKANADLVREVLSGTAETPDALARRNLVAANAAATLRISGVTDSWPDAVRKASQLLTSGTAYSVLEQLIAFTSAL